MWLHQFVNALLQFSEFTVCDSYYCRIGISLLITFFLLNKIQRVSEISTLILTSDRSRQEQNCYVFSKYNFHFSILPPIN
jgi:hypothetical protein